MMECIIVEINVEKSKNIIISCAYKEPASCVDTFNDKMVDVCDKMNEKQTLVKSK